MRLKINEVGDYKLKLPVLRKADFFFFSWEFPKFHFPFFPPIAGAFTTTVTRASFNTCKNKMTYANESDYNPHETKSFSLGYSKRPFIAFVKSKSEEEEHSSQKKLHTNGQQVASFYRDLVQSDSNSSSIIEGEQKTKSSQEYPICEVCQTPIHDSDRHNLNAAHLSALSNPQAPLSTLSFDPESISYKYLVKHGWSPFQPTGLGVPGREGSRVPIKTELKNDKYGIGVLPATTAQQQQNQLPPQVISNATQAKQYDESQKRKRKRVYHELYGDPKVNEYFGI
jgi:hypothetical protein